MKIESKLNKKENWINECTNCTVRNCDGSWNEQINCCRLGNHVYSEIECPNCGHIYCAECAAHGGNNSYGCGEWNECPACGEVKYEG